MATLSQLEAAGALVRIDVSLDDRLAWRVLYGTPEFIQWLDTILPTLETGIVGAPLTPLEQVDDLFFEFISGARLQQDRRFKPIRYVPDLHVWELKTTDIRIFGWFHAMDTFICCFGAMKDDLVVIKNGVRRPDASTYAARTNFVREKLNLDDPKAVTFKEYANVLSDHS